MSDIPLLDRYREAGYTITAEANALRVVAEHPISDRIRQVFKAKKPELLRELAAEYREKAIFAARDAADLGDWRAPLDLGRLHLCGNCARFAFGPDAGGLGTCALHGDGLLPFLPFDCPDFTVERQADRTRVHQSAPAAH